MAETKRLYYTDSYVREMRTRVLSVSADGLRVMLEETVFYPTSGGQPHDVGTLNGVAVVDVVDEEEGIVHVLEKPLMEERVEGRIDWARRYDHMQQHTGQHLLSAVFEELYRIPTLSFHMGADESTIELGTREIGEEQMGAGVARATELARANPQVRTGFEEAGQAQGLRKASGRAGLLRIVEISGIDRSGCGGTHVAGLSEVLPLQIREAERVRGNVRVSFVCGNRAMARARTDFLRLARTAQMLATSAEGVEAQVAGLQQRLAEAEKQRQRLEAESARRAGLDLYQAADADEDGIRRVLVREAALNENARTKAKAFVSAGKAVMLMQSAEGMLVACSADAGVNAGAVLKEALAKFGARGGGSATMAQGSLPDARMVNELAGQLGWRLLPETDEKNGGSADEES